MSKAIWRDAKPSDLPDIQRLWDEQERRFSGTNVPVDRPPLFDESELNTWIFKPLLPPIMRARVAEKDGQVVGFRYVEAVPEVCLVTGDEDAMKSLARELTEECYHFKALGFRSGWGLVPEKFFKSLSRFVRHSAVRPWNSLRLIGCNFSELGD